MTRQHSFGKGHTMANIGIIGSAGRMGHAIAEALHAAGHTLAGGIDRDGDVEALAAASDVLIDFSSPAALEANLDAAAAAGKPILIGTTGLEERHHWLIDHASEKVPVLQTGNTSLGINMLSWLVEEAARRLGEDWDIEIVETHHRMKVDALGHGAASGRSGCARAPDRFGRPRRARPRRHHRQARKRHHRFRLPARGQRGGDHTVHFLADNERLPFRIWPKIAGSLRAGP
jgi:4-hydroxy-tetrahydrodipicolinate reductase